MDLSQIRQEIDAIDAQLVKLLCQRMALSGQVANYKKANNLPILVPAREQAILQSIAEQAGPEMAPHVQRLYETLFAVSRDYQAEVMK